MINPFKRTYTQTELSFFDFLAQNRLFEELTKKELLLFLPFLYLRKYTKNEVLFFRNDPGQALYLIKSGTITFKLDIGQRFESIAHVPAPAVIGNSALLHKAKRVYTAVVTSEMSEVYVLPQVNIFNIFERRPVIKAKMLEALSEIYHQDFSTLFNTYQSTQGFFDLSHVFEDFKYGC